MRLADYTLEDNRPPYVIAEIGVNHEGSIEKAKNLIRLAKEGGANAAKFQTYKADTLASRHSPAYWDLSKEQTTSQHELFKKYDSFGRKDYEELAAFCREVGIDFLSTPFDDAAVEFLDPLVPFFKISSSDLTNTPFLRRIAAKGKPVVLATGCSTLAEVGDAVHVLEASGCREIALLHCILNYPTENRNAHLRMIRGLSRAFPDKVIGYSDHTLPDEFMTSLVTAFLQGALIIEKHFTYDKRLPGNDHYHAMDVQDLKNFRKHVDRVLELLGPSEHKQPIASEEISRRNARRSLVLSRDVKAGTTLTSELVTYKRPGTGISPRHWDEVLGGKAARDLPADHILQWQDLALQK